MSQTIWYHIPPCKEAAPVQVQKEEAPPAEPEISVNTHNLPSSDCLVLDLVPVHNIELPVSGRK